ncbi:MAG: isoleucine--tRNA ligase [Candidatus Micrarchaeia archaeon]
MELNRKEEEILKFWLENNVNQKIKEKNKDGKKFYFLEGPPYVTGVPGFHHAWVIVTKDLLLRYKRYKGFNVHDRAGFDVHGLPTEVKVEKLLNVTSKKDIAERIGVDNFIEKCKSYVDEEVKADIKIFERYGSSLDYSTTYIPYKKDYIDKGWWLFKKIFEKKLVYEGSQPLAYCPHCETVLAQGPEIEYGTESDPSIFIKFKVKAETSNVNVPENTYFVVWTTTPWTLVSNVAIAVNPKLVYVLVSSGGENYIVAKDRLDEFSASTGLNVAVLSEFYGSELAGTEYEHFFGKDVPVQNKIARYHKIIESETFVLGNEGTGLLHVAPGHGPEDFKLGKAEKLPILSPVDEQARYTEEAGIFANLDVPKSANEALLKYLHDKSVLLFKGSISHSYPHCWRCGSKLIYRATRQWYINVEKLKGKMLKENSKVKWYPSIASEWFMEAIKSSPDWTISRQRYWGIPIPIWKCDACNALYVVGSSKELAELSGKELEDMHRPYVDSIAIKCQKCGGTMHRISDIFDVWYDSGVAHTASLSSEEFEKLFPADWISESGDQIRGWFATLLRTSVAVYGKTPYLNVNFGGMVKDELGQEMHRHLGNAINASEILDISSADGFRLWSLSKPRWQELRLKKHELEEANSNIITIYNIAELAKELAQLSKINTKAEIRLPGKLELEERWIISKLNSVIANMTNWLDSYMLDNAVKEIRDFLLVDLSRFYLKFAKQRAEYSKRDLRRVSLILNYIFKQSLILSSIVIPFSSESIYQDIYADGNSIFMNDWPKPKKHSINADLEEKFELFKDIANAILSLREQKKAKLRWPINSVTIKSSSYQILEEMAELVPLIKMYANAKDVKLEKRDTTKRAIKPVFAKIGPAFKGDAQIVADELQKQDADSVSNEIAKSGFYPLHTSKGVFNILPEHVVIIESPAQENEGTISFKGSIIGISIDTELTEELRNELLVREFVRRIQIMRKEMQLKKMNSVRLYSIMPEKFVSVLSEHEEEIKKIAGLSSINYKGNIPDGIHEKSWDILGEKVTIALEKA